MSRADNLEIMTTFDLKQWIEGEGLSFTETRGRSGAQLNLKVCPHCGDRRSKVYLNEENGIGNCFACDEGFNKAKFVKASLDLSWADTFKRIREACKEQGWRPRKRIEVAVDQREVGSDAVDQRVTRHDGCRRRAARQCS